MKSLQRYGLLVSIAALVSLTGCGYWPGSSKRATEPPRATAAPEAKALIPVPLPAPTEDERLALALDHLGAKHGTRGEIWRLTDAMLFVPGKTSVKQDESDLDHLVTVLHDYPKTDLIIEGYTDNQGNPHHNDRVSLQRANAVRHVLVAHGIDEKRIRTRGLGPADPVANNHTREGRDENRRVELIFSDAAGHFAAAADATSAAG
jgi:OOP family OmpA-OmpF porin